MQASLQRASCFPICILSSTRTARLQCSARRRDDGRMDDHLARSERTRKAFRDRDRVAGIFVQRAAGGLRLDASLEEAAGAAIESIRLRIGRADHVLRYLRNGYTSWDGSYFIELENARGVVTAETGALTGHAVTALVASNGAAAVLGFLRHDRFQSRFRFAFDGPLTIDAETLIDHARGGERITAEPLILLAGPIEDTLRAWARAVAR